MVWFLEIFVYQVCIQVRHNVGVLLAMSRVDYIGTGHPISIHIEDLESLLQSTLLLEAFTHNSQFSLKQKLIQLLGILSNNEKSWLELELVTHTSS